jgi:two-component system, chemotaxis family, response regulator Rcp1
MTAKAILLVEDSAADVYLMQRAVAECGRDLHLWTMPDGLEDLAFLRKEHPLTHVPTPALIVVDLRLPKMHGTQLLTDIRQLPGYQTTPVVVLSSTPKEREEQHCLQLGATAYVQKSLTDFSAYFTSLTVLVKQWLHPAGEKDEERS